MVLRPDQVHPVQQLVHRVQGRPVVPDVVVGDHHMLVPGQRDAGEHAEHLAVAPAQRRVRRHVPDQSAPGFGVPGERLRRRSVDHHHVDPPAQLAQVPGQLVQAAVVVGAQRQDVRHRQPDRRGRGARVAWRRGGRSGHVVSPRGG
ncbi:hypothetical protein AB0893_24130 [Micromonospora aurantiaca]|uniref:hypothetical protein n=1 Tax=Micromonospora aurantiaca (nom. illeg.) TaxID=47850 RepID=UPI003453CBA2